MLFSGIAWLCILACTLFCTSTTAQFTNASSNASTTTYTNPILSTVGADPWAIRYGRYYYMTYTTNDNITILRSSTLTSWDDADVKLAFLPPSGLPYSTDLWAPELHQLNGTWYIIFTADPNFDTPSPQIDMFCPYNCPAVHHRMYVLEGSSSDPWESTYTLKGQLNTYDQFAIDGTYFTHSTGLYHIYSCWYDTYSAWPSNLCITKLLNPWTVSSNFSDRQIISVPTNAWEKTPYGRAINDRLSSNEGPQQLINPATGQNFLIYSAARSDNRNYCLGQLELVGQDPMNPSDWRKNNEGCVFYQNPMEQAHGVGHASFVKSEDGSEDWIVYHGMRDPTDGWSARTIRTQRFGWNEDGSPKFPRPGYGPYDVPSGQD
ncbi:glycosyl hydrolase [Delphinella strobiligena]|nr:glycosyl hydrolase [Delphinella strobiligena]